jgi:hypothetical protein
MDNARRVAARPASAANDWQSPMGILESITRCGTILIIVCVGCIMTAGSIAAFGQCYANIISSVIIVSDVVTWMITIVFTLETYVRTSVSCVDCTLVITILTWWSFVRALAILGPVAFIISSQTSDLCDPSEFQDVFSIFVVVYTFMWIISVWVVGTVIRHFIWRMHIPYTSSVSVADAAADAFASSSSSAVVPDRPLRAAKAPGLLMVSVTLVPIQTLLGTHNDAAYNTEAPICLICHRGNLAGAAWGKCSTCSSCSHAACLMEWLRHSPTCPTCRGSVRDPQTLVCMPQRLDEFIPCDDNTCTLEIASQEDEDMHMRWTRACSLMDMAISEERKEEKVDTEAQERE